HPTRQSRAARVAGLHPPRSEGGEGGGGDVPSQFQARYRQGHHGAGKGEALVSFLEGNGTPSMVERCMVRPPSAGLGPITPDERKALMAASPVKGKYDQTVDSESAYELLQKRLHSGAAGGPIVAPQGTGGAEQAPQPSGLGAVLSTIGGVLGDIFGTTRPRRTRLLTGPGVAPAP